MIASHISPKIGDLKGVGPAAVRTLNELGIRTITDLFGDFPYRYDNYEIMDPQTVENGASLTTFGRVQSKPLLTFYAKRRSRITVRVMAGRSLITVVAFNRPYLKKSLSLGREVTVTGKWDRNRAELTATEFHVGEQNFNEAIAPVYSVKDGLTVRRLRAIVRQAMAQFPDAIVETLPHSLLERYRLSDRKTAIQEIHFPTSRESLKQARRRLVYEEFLNYELKMQSHKQIRQKSETGIRMDLQTQEVQKFIDQLPFTLTEAQKRVVREILDDLQAPYPMNRLLQGDVGSGKTVVAAIALYAAVSAGYQGALMAPTEILAEQHADSLQKLFQPLSVNVAMLTGNVHGKERQLLLQELASGHIDILVGTHALIQDDVHFSRLGLVITDEQHRFGVNQRKKLRTKGKEPGVLYMTATPIPRTLAITVFGDMDVSTINELPGGRKAIRTYWIRHNMTDRLIVFIRKQLAQRRQAYVVCPLIAESEQLDVQNAIDVHADLVRALPGFHVGLMHGKLTPEEKAAVMDGFKENKIQALVSTTVVEVGVDVPNATLMIIDDAERFGLSQLHQLRGRVGRGKYQSYCILISDAKSETSQERLRLMTETSDGFRLSSFDLQLRGPGDFFGKNQSGLPEFKLADMVHDYKTLAAARDDAAKLVNLPEFWKKESFRLLRQPLIDSGITESVNLD
jgi:ATP-dependent DNA helicase RecG